MMPLFSAMNTRPSLANWTAVGKSSPLIAVVSWNPLGRVIAPAAPPSARTRVRTEARRSEREGGDMPRVRAATARALLAMRSHIESALASRKRPMCAIGKPNCASACALARHSGGRRARSGNDAARLEGGDGVPVVPELEQDLLG